MAPSHPTASIWPRLLLVFLLVPIIELGLLIWVGGQIGFWPTMGLIILTALAGSWLAQREGLAVWRRFQSRLASGQMPGKELTDGLIILFSGALLLTPGVLTDVVGLLGLFPPSRAAIRAFVSRRMQRGLVDGNLHVYSFGGRSPSTTPGPDTRPDGPEDDVVDVPFEEFRRPGGR